MVCDINTWLRSNHSYGPHLRPHSKILWIRIVYPLLDHLVSNSNLWRDIVNANHRYWQHWYINSDVRTDSPRRVTDQIEGDRDNFLTLSPELNRNIIRTEVSMTRSSDFRTVSPRRASDQNKEDRLNLFTLNSDNIRLIDNKYDKQKRPDK